jgi:putative flippase GtrA
VRWIFVHRGVQNRTLEYLLFILLGTVSLVLNGVLLYMCTETIGMPYPLSKIVAGSLLFLLTFFLRRWILFRSPAGALSACGGGNG